VNKSNRQTEKQGAVFGFFFFFFTPKKSSKQWIAAQSIKRALFFFFCLKLWIMSIDCCPINQKQDSKTLHIGTFMRCLQGINWNLKASRRGKLI